MSKPLAVLISDVHYNIHTIPLADAALRQAISKANKLQVPLIVAGDLHDTKANLRGECINAMLFTFSHLKGQAYILIGNHDRINEKSPDHSLNFLRGDHVSIIDIATPMEGLSLIPYHNDPDELRRYLEAVPKDMITIMHQGITGSNMGEYVVDHSAIRPEDVAGRRVISGHYHSRQTISLPNGGSWDYIGNPYSLSFGEAKDPEKGYQVLYNDGSLEFVPTNLRKHIIYDMSASEYMDYAFRIVHCLGDSVWVKIRGPKAVLSNIHPTQISKAFGPCKLDLIPDDQEVIAPALADTMSQSELLDSMIDSMTNTGDDTKERLKALWRVCASN